MEHWEQFTVCVLCPVSVGVEQTTFLKWKRDQFKRVFPETLEELKGTGDVLPVLEVVVGVGDGFRVSSFQQVLRREDDGLLLH